MMQVRHSLLAMVLLTAACSTQAPPPQRAANPNRYIYVTSENLAEQCYRDLGPINLTEPFAQATVESGDTTMEIVCARSRSSSIQHRRGYQCRCGEQ